MATRVQNGGLARITLLLSAAAWWFQWGTGTGAPASANVVTTTTTTEARSAATMSQQTVTVTNDTLRAVGTIVALGTRAITEVGIFDAAGAASPPVGGNMDMYGDFAVVNLLINDSIGFTFNTTFV